MPTQRHIPRAALAPLFFVAVAQAQTTSNIPDAGSLRQQIEQPREFSLPQAVRPPKVTPPPEIQARDGMSVKVKTIRFAGNSLLGEPQLSAAVADFVNRELDFAGLQRVADAVAAAYREAGWLVRAYLPEQDISEGVVTVQVIEARFGGVRLEGESSQRVKAAELQAFFNEAQPVGEFLNANALDRALLLTDDLPGVSVAGTLAPGQSDGETVLVMQTTDEPFVYGDVGLDNTGTLSTGSNRLTASLNINSPGGRGELISVIGLHTEGSDYGRVALTVPERYNGLRLGASLSSMTYKVINGPGATAQVQGRSNSMGFDLNYPLVRSRMFNLYASAGAENKSFYTQDTTGIRSDYESYSVRTGLSGNRFDDLAGGGANSASVQMLWGRLTSMRQHSLLGTIDPNYHKLSYSFSRQQTLVGDHSLLLSLQGQHATQLLDTSEKFYIGGAQSVRAYPASELGGERGQLLTAEWRWRVDSAWVVTAFVDHGRVVALPASVSDQRTALSLRGHGLSASWQTPLGVVTKLTWSRRDGHNPKANINTGADGDGTLKLNRLWLTANVAF